MRKQATKHGKLVWLSARDTEDWATNPDASWPCSFLRGKSVLATFDHKGDLVNIKINNGRGDQDCPADEFNAIMADLAT